MSARRFLEPSEQPEIMDNTETQKKTTFLIRITILITIPVILIIVGIALLVTCGQLLETSEQVVDYTNCMKSSFDPSTETCAEYKKTHPDQCECLFSINLTINLVGEVILYYRIDEFDQLKYAKSRDDKQLSGHLSTEVSPECGPFNYTSEGKPIAPCGALADSMFNDTYEVQLRDNKVIILESLDYGMIKDKGFYRNPPGNESLEVLFQNYSKPINWVKNVWELSSNRSSNGFENERFIGWMDTSLKRKPALRLDPTKFISPQNGKLTLRIEYNYPPNLYSGPRKVILTATRVIEGSSAKYGAGVTILILGIIGLVAAVVVIAWRVRENRWHWH